MPTEGVQLSICLVLTRHRRLVGAAGTRLPPSYGAPARLSNDGTEDAGDPGIATSVSPRPNRLVLLGANRPHRIARVNENAGSQRPHQYRRFFLALTVTMEEAATWSTVDQPHRSFELNGISRMGEPVSDVPRADLVPGTTSDADKVGDRQACREWPPTPCRNVGAPAAAFLLGLQVADIPEMAYPAPDGHLYDVKLLGNRQV